MKRRKKKKGLTLDSYVCFSIGALIVYTIAERLISAVTGTSADVLTGCFFGAFAGEILSCCLIKLLKLKKEGQDDERIDL